MAPKGPTGLRAVVVYLPWVGRLVLAVIVGLLLFAGYRAAASANFFQIKSIDVTGTVRVSPDEVRALVRRDIGHTGVWNADVKALRTELEEIPWVRSATVSRVLPDGLRVRITERVPYAIVHTDTGKLVWVDDEAVVLGPMSLQRDQLPPFFLRGWDSGWGERQENRKRLELYAKILTAWQSMGLADKVSELDLTNPKYVLANLSGNYSQVTVKLWTTDYAEGLQRALEKLAAAPNVAGVSSVTVLPNRTILDVAQSPATPVGEGTPVGESTAAAGVEPEPEAETAPRAVETAPKPARSANDRSATTKPKPANSQRSNPKPERNNSSTETRPRRVNR
jgi:cell division protein FtsQ